MIKKAYKQSVIRSYIQQIDEKIVKINNKITDLDNERVKFLDLKHVFEEHVGSVGFDTLKTRANKLLEDDKRW